MTYRNILSLRPLLGLTLLLGLGACSSSGKKADKPSATTSDSARLVEVSSIARSTISDEEVYTTVLEARTVNHISSQTGGRLSKLSVKIGDRVARGQVLAQLDASSLNQARLRLEDSKTSYGRIDELYRVGGISKASWEAAKSAMDLAQQVYNNVAENTLLRSPIAGVVTKKNYDTGDMTSPAQPIVVVEELSPVKAVLHVSEAYFSRLGKGMEVSVSVDALEGKSFTGRIANIYPTIDPSTHTVGIEVEIPNGQLELRPGMYARVNLGLGEREVLLVPEEAVVRQAGSGERNVFVISEGKATYRAVTLGRLYGSSYEVLSGLAAGDQVITSSAATLVSGASVKTKSSH